jgi:hypothetical protein
LELAPGALDRPGEELGVHLNAGRHDWGRVSSWGGRGQWLGRCTRQRGDYHADQGEAGEQEVEGESARQ